MPPKDEPKRSSLAPLPIGPWDTYWRRQCEEVVARMLEEREREAAAEKRRQHRLMAWPIDDDDDPDAPDCLDDTDPVPAPE